MVRAFSRLLLLAAALAAPAFLPAAPPAGGSVLALAPSASLEGVVYAATESGVVRSTDGGATWSLAGQGLPAGRVTGLAIDPTNAETAYAASHLGLYRTTNGGASWIVIGLRTPLFDVAVAPSSSSVLYASDGEIVYRSDDGGSLWFPASGGLPEVLLIAGLTVDPGKPDTVYAASNLGIFRTTDGGGAWQAVGEGLGAVRAVAANPKHPNILYAATATRGVLKSWDRGATWSPSSQGFPPSGDVIAVSLDPAYPTTLFAAVSLESSGAIYRSRDAGASWKQVQTTQTLPRDLAVDPKRPDRVYVGLERLGLLRSENGGGTWGVRELPRAERLGPARE